jgi:hypothetical protein
MKDGFLHRESSPDHAAENKGKNTRCPIHKGGFRKMRSRC